MAKCKCKIKGVGATRGGIDTEAMLFLGAGAIGSMALTNPLESALYKDKPVPKWFSPAAKFAMAYAAFEYTDDEKVQAAGVGAAAAGFIELAKAYFPTVLGRKIPGANLVQPTVEGIGEVIDLNDPKWDIVSGYDDGEVLGTEEKIYDDIVF
jgi:hypothetical protein